jgi:hypothetical protein
MFGIPVKKSSFQYLQESNNGIYIQEHNSPSLPSKSRVISELHNILPGCCIIQHSSSSSSPGATLADGVAMTVADVEATVYSVVGTALDVNATAVWVEVTEAAKEEDSDGAPDPPTVKSTQDSYV